MTIKVIRLLQAFSYVTLPTVMQHLVISADSQSVC